MYHNSNYPYPYNMSIPGNVPVSAQQPYRPYPCPYSIPPYQYDPNPIVYPYNLNNHESIPEYGYMDLQDYGDEPFAINIHEAANQNTAFRTALWTGTHLQLTLMSLDVGEDIGFEIHDDLDQFIRIEEGSGTVLMGESREDMEFQADVDYDSAFIIPAGIWHNLINTGNTPLKLYSIYAPPQHPYGTVHETKEDAMAAEEHDH